MSKLVNDLIRDGYLRTDSIVNAFSQISRIEFVPVDLERVAEVNISLPIGHGQTVPEPLLVAFMLELLEPKEGQNILEIGSGSGWTTSLLCSIVGETGKVTAIEPIEQLCDMSKENADKYDFVKKGIAQFYCQDGMRGFEKNAPYDRIIVSAGVEEIPQQLKEQLKIGGKMIIPVFKEVWYMEKKGEDEFYKEAYPGFTIVPMEKLKY